MKKTMLFLAVLGLLILGACGSTPTSNEAPVVDSGNEEAKGEGEAEPVVNIINSANENFDVAPGEAMMLTNYDGKELFVVFYDWTNNSDDTTSAMVSLYVRAFQDGAQLNTGYLGENDLPADKMNLYDNDWKDIRPGTTLTCYAGFELTSSSPVEVEFSEFLGDDITMQIYNVE